MPINRIPVAAQAATAAVALSMAMLVYETTQRAMESAAAVDHSVQVLGHISALESSLARADAAQRGFHLFVEAPFIAERDAALGEARARAEIVRDMTRGNFAQQARIADVFTLLAARAERMRANAQARLTMPSVEDLREAVTTGREMSRRIYAVTGEMGSEERRLLQQRQASQADSFRATRLAVLAAMVFLAAIVACAFLLNRRAERARLEAERRVYDLAESLPGAVFQYRMFPDGRARYELLSKNTRELRGVDPEAALRDPRVVLDTVLEADRPLLLRAVARNAESLLPLTIDYRVQVGGELKWIRSTSAPHREEDGSILWSGHWDDVSTQRGLEEELLRAKEAADAASRAKSTFLATMSHEIRTPMNGVLAMLELLSLTRLDAEQRAALAIVRESGTSLLRIIDDILDMSKVEAGKLDLVSEPFSVRDVIERVCNIHSGAASRKGLALKRVFDSRIAPALVGDPLRIQQILGNFTSNAVKFTHAGGVTISAHLAEGKADSQVIEFAVADTGMGLSDEQKARLFQPFTQVHAAAAQRAGGSGLGLSIVQRLALLMAGSLGVESEVGRGTHMTFVVELPIAQADARGSVPREKPGIAVRAPPTIEEAERANRLLLLVDDHPVNRMVLLRQVNALGYAAETAEDGRDALGKWTSGRFAAVITDCNMAEMSGYELVRTIRAREKEMLRTRTVVIACTGNALDGDAGQCFEAGMDEYLAKPFSLEQLSAKLARFLPLESGQPKAAAGDAPLDRSMIDEVAGGDAGLARELLSRFMHYNADDACRLREALTQGDLEGIAQCAHRIKGAARTIGANPLAIVCEAIEHSAKSRDPGAAAASLGRFEMEVRTLHEYISNHAEVAPDAHRP